MQHFRAKLLVAVVAFGALLGAARDELTGAPAPDFVLKGASGTNVRLSEYRGEVVLLGFWASWCGECRSQLDGLSALEGSGVELLSVSLDSARHQVIDTVDALGIGFPALHDAGGIVGEQYDVDDLPRLLLIDQEGIVREVFVGYRKGDEQTYLDRASALLAD